MVSELGEVVGHGVLGASIRTAMRFCFGIVDGTIASLLCGMLS